MEMGRKVVVITGASRGIGEAIAHKLCRQFDLIINGQSEMALKTVEAKLKSTGALVTTVVGSVTNPVVRENIVGALGNRPCWGLVNNAGLAASTSFLSMSEAEFDEIFEVNIRAMYFLTQKIVQHMIRFPHSHGGRIVNMASVAGIYRVPKFPGFSAYSASKAAVIAFSESLASELKDRKITVNAVSPGGVDTAMFAKVSPPGSQAALQPQEIADVVSFFLQETNSKISGVNWEAWSG